MLTRRLRVTSSTDHREVSRHGSRASTSRLVVHLLLASEGVADQRRGGVPPPARFAQPTGAAVPPLPTPDALAGGARPPDLDGAPEWLRPARAGVVVGRPVGNAVVRHRVARRLRHLLAPRLMALPGGARLVVRARPGAGSASSDVLGGDLDDALASASRSARMTRAPRSGRSGGQTRPTAPVRPAAAGVAP